MNTPPPWSAPRDAVSYITAAGLAPQPLSSQENSGVVDLRITVDGASPGADAGVDVDASGAGVVRDHRLYNLVRRQGPVREAEFVIEFLDAGAGAYSFTFG